MSVRIVEQNILEHIIQQVSKSCQRNCINIDIWPKITISFNSKLITEDGFEPAVNVMQTENQKQDGNNDEEMQLTEQQPKIGINKEALHSVMSSISCTTKVP